MSGSDEEEFLCKWIKLNSLSIYHDYSELWVGLRWSMEVNAKSAAASVGIFDTKLITAQLRGIDRI